MKIINPPDKVIMQLTGSKVYDSKLKYRLLKWVGVIQVDEENESHLKIFGKPERGTILHNYITGETLYFEPEEDFRDYMEHLVKGLFFVPYDHDDEKTVHQLRSALRLMNTKKDVTSFKILTTTDCNARCFYCYESGIKKHDMSLETADKVAEYIIKKSGKKKVTLAWFGGEPLMGTEVIDRICSRVKETGMEYISVMTSNGYLFDEEQIEKSVIDWNLKNIQITLDGTKKIYNKVKAYTDAEDDPYERVLKNIRNLADAGVRVNIRLNMGAGNFDDTLKLIDELSAGFSENENVSAYVSGLFQELEKDDVTLKKDLSEKLIIAAKKIADSGLDRPKIKNIHTRTGGCMADNDNHIGISPSGKLMKCEHFIFDRLVGDIDSGKDDELSKGWKERMPDGDLCGKCTVRPVCYRLEGCPVSHPCDEFEQREFTLRKESQILKNWELINRKGAKNVELTAVSDNEIC